MKQLFTPGEVAKMCSVASRTVVKWFNSGLLPGFRIPGSKHRRVTRAHLAQFLKDNDMPVNFIEADALRMVLLVGADGETERWVRERLTEGAGYSVDAVSSTFEAGYSMACRPPECVIVDLSIGRVESGQMAGRIRDTGRHDHLAVVGIAASGTATVGLPSFHAVFPRPIDAGVFTATIKRLIAAKREVEA